MEQVLEDIRAALRQGKTLNGHALEAIMRAHNKGLGSGDRRYTKTKLLAWFLRLRDDQPDLWERLGIDAGEEAALLQVLRAKPRRSASGVATITVIMKPWKCRGNCVYCPNDVRMPKSYLHDEPACQRAERNWFDPYLQVTSRLRALSQMGHVTDKVELIILGGTFSDYEPDYRLWFVAELFRALNDADNAEAKAAARRAVYRQLGIAQAEEELAAQVGAVQTRVDAGALPFNDAIGQLYGEGTPWAAASEWQRSTWEQLEGLQRANENAAHRVVGLVVETRPDLVTPENLRDIRRLGATKVQMGVQTLCDSTSRLTERGIDNDGVARAFALLRAYGFKTHAHFMLNLPGADCQEDASRYRQLMEDPRYRPDEVKLYPCMLIGGTGLQRLYERGSWVPYSDDQLVDVLAADLVATPPFARVSRMIRDFSAGDIVAGSKRTNLRQMVEAKVAADGSAVREIRYRELATGVFQGQLTLNDYVYDTANSQEHFLEWTTEEGKIAGFLRLSLPDADYVSAANYDSAGAVGFDAALTEGGGVPLKPGDAMIREVHIYGAVAALGKGSAGAQHRGLGRQLIARACEIAADAGYDNVLVISAVGTRNYYRRLGFEDAGLYQQRPSRERCSLDAQSLAGQQDDAACMVTAPETAARKAVSQQLANLNTQFYAHQSMSFEATRHGSWKGWERCASWIDGLVSDGGSLRVADIACGSLRFPKYLAQKLESKEISFLCVDSCRDLMQKGWESCSEVCTADNVDLIETDVLSRVFGREALFGGAAGDAAGDSGAGPAIDAAVCFGFFHHVPYIENRKYLLESLVRSVRPGGLAIVSLWCFMRSDEMAQKTRALQETAHSETSVDISLLEENDFFVGWDRMPGVWRYCHHFCDDEIDQLVASVSGDAELVDRFAADGRTGNLNEYLVLRRLNA